MSNDGIEPDELWAQTTAIATTPAKSSSQNRRLTYIGSGAFAAMFLIGLVSTLALDKDEPAATVVTTSFAPSTPSSTSPSTTLASVPNSAVTATTQVPVESTTTISEISTTTMPGVAVSHTMTVAGPAGIAHVTGTASSVFDSQPWALAFQLSDGSYIAQHVVPGSGQQGDTDIYRIGATTTTVKSVANPATDWIRLHDVYTEAGATFVLYSLGTNVATSEAKEELLALDLNTGLTTSFGIVGGMNSGTSRLTYGGSVIVGELFEEANAGPFFLALDGFSINPNDFGLADAYDNCDVCPSRFTVDPSGQRIAWVEADLLVVLDRQSARRVAEIRLPQGLYTTIDSLDLLGDQILINGRDRNTGELGKPILMSFAGTSTTLDSYGTATFDQ